MAKLRIIFMGTPEFAVPSLKILHDHGYDIVGVITAPDKPKGRGQKIATSPVKDFASANNLTVLQPTNLKSPQFLDQLEKLQATLQVVVAFRMLPDQVWSMPILGTFNLHASLLPQYRGAAPINWAVINGEKETGVTTFFLKHEIDTGSLIFQDRETIAPEDTAGTLYSRLMTRGAKLVLKTVQAIEKGDYPNVPQVDSSNLRKAPKIFKEDCKINWDRSVDDVYNFIRGLSPYPGAWTSFGGKTIKIYQSVPLTTGNGEPPGKVLSDDKSYFRFTAQAGQLDILELQLEGKKRMNVLDFLRGNRL